MVFGTDPGDVVPRAIVLCHEAVNELVRFVGSCRESEASVAACVSGDQILTRGVHVEPGQAIEIMKWPQRV